MDDDIVFQLIDIWNKAKRDSPLSQKSAVCVSTIDEKGYPQSRFVDLKAIDASGATFCSSYESHKAKHLLTNPRVSLCAWWDHIGFQIRLVGNATPISSNQAEIFWKTRSYEAQVATLHFEQSQQWSSNLSMSNEFTKAIESAPKLIPCPEKWGGFTIAPVEIEFLEFKTSRLHHRQKYKKSGDTWSSSVLQP